jgi:cyclopropane-fatty-acyl-phospholipid synthase
MSRIFQALREAGIFCYGSKELENYEKRLSRYFSREYTRYLTQQKASSCKQIVTDDGPMVLQTQDLMELHYDKQLPLFKSFLDRHYMAYTMAYYGEEPKQIIASRLSLETAQRQKFKLICQRADLSGDEHILNLGCGFGSFETYLFETYPDIKVTSLTSSEVQAAYLQNCIEDPRHPIKRGQCQLHRSVFGSGREEGLVDGSYDVVFAIGLFEHINNLHTAFERISKLLAPTGRCFLHLIVSIPSFPQYQDSRDTLIGKYFPGGRIWPFGILNTENDFFCLEGSWYLNGMNYWKTLDEWHRRYWEHIPELYGNPLDTDAIRHWNDYFILCKVVLFAPLNGTVYGNGHYLFRKKPRLGERAVRHSDFAKHQHSI